MRWDRNHQSSDVDDRRGASGGRGGMKIGIGGAIVLVILSVIFKRNMFTALGIGDVGAPQGQGQTRT